VWINRVDRMTKIPKAEEEAEKADGVQVQSRKVSQLSYAFLCVQYDLQLLFS